MKTKIEQHLDDPKQLEGLYRENKTLFKKAFEGIYPEIKQHPTAQVWHERLTYSDITWGSKNELMVIIGLSFIAGLIAKIPFFMSLPPDYFYARNISFVVFPVLAAYFAWKQSLPIHTILVVAGSILVSAIYINQLPNSDNSDTLTLSCIHLPLFLWAILGYTFTGKQFNHYPKRIDFLRYNGDLIVMTTVILISGALLSAITIGLFELINIRLEVFYFEYIAIWGLAAAPIVGTYLVQTNPQLVKNVSPVIAKVFTPLVLTTLVLYLGAIIYTGKDPYNDREFLIIFNLLLVGVMVIILFSITETSANRSNNINTWLVFALSTVTILINAIALSAIVFRISEWGITPNRLAVLGSNILILIHLIMVSYRLFKSLKHPDELVTVENSIASYLPVYTIWTIIVTFLFPVLFGFK